MTNQEYSETLIGSTSKNYGTKFQAYFTQEEVVSFLTKLGYRIVEHKGPNYMRVDGMDDSKAIFAHVHTSINLAVKDDDVIPERNDAPEINRLGMMIVFQYEMKKKLLAL